MRPARAEGDRHGRGWTLYRLGSDRAGAGGQGARGLRGRRELLDRAQASGAIEGFETVLLGPHGGDLAGFILVRGSSEQIAAVRANEEFQRVNARAGAVVDGLGIIDAVLGDGIGPAMTIFQDVIAEFS